MPLLDLKTDLKSLKYGKDLPGGGNSGQPYQQVDINKVDSGFNRFRMTKFDDGLVRGGVVGAANASIVDTFRIGKFLKDLPKGPLFITKQVGLQLSNPKIETSKSGKGNVGRLGPTRFYNLGINTLAQIPVNAFGGHFVRHGLSPVQSDQTKYLRVAQENNTEKDNRLTKLKTRFGLGVVDSGAQKEQVFLRRKELKSIKNAGATSAMLLKANEIQSAKIDDYAGGPNSVYGIGRTLIRRTPEYTNDNLRITEAANKAFNSKHIPEVKLSDNFDFGISLITGSILAKEKFELNKSIELNLNSSLLNYNVTNYNAQKDKDKQSNSYTSASLGVRAGKFIKASNFSSSSFSTLKFNNGKSIASISGSSPSSLNDNTINTFVSPNRFNTTGSRIISSSADLRISNTTGSILAKADFDLITDTGLNPSGSFLDYNITSYDAFQKAKDNQVISYTSASTGLSTNRFVRVSNYSSSSLSALKFNNGNPINASTFNQPSSLNNTTINTFVSPSRPNTTGSRVVSSSAALGISDITGDTTIPNYNNVINYTSTDPKTRYTQLRTQIDNGSVGKTTGFASIASKISKSGLGSKAIKQLSSLQSNRTNDKNIDEDTMAIKIVPVDAFSGKNIETLRFLAYLTNYSDNYDSGWNDVKYAGRSEKFYIFTDFKRNVNIEFNIPCFNESELIEKHTELNRLVSILAGQYQGNFLGGVISKITLGSYLVNQPGIINNLNFAPLPESPWDLDARLAQYIKVSFGFTVIHNFLPEFGMPFIDVNGAQTRYLEAKQKQLAEAEAAAAAAASTDQQAQLTTDNGTNTTTRANVFDRNVNLPVAKPVSAQSLQIQAQVTNQQQQTKKTTTVNARKSVGKTVPKKEEEKPVKIGGMPMPYPKETQFNSIIGGAGLNPNKGPDSPYSPSNQKPIATPTTNVVASAIAAARASAKKPSGG